MFQVIRNYVRNSNSRNSYNFAYTPLEEIFPRDLGERGNGRSRPFHGIIIDIWHKCAKR